MVKNYKFDARKKDNAWQLILSYKDKRGKWHQKTQQGYSKRSIALSDEEKQKLLDRVPPEDLLDPAMAEVTLGDFLEIFKEDQENTLTYNTLRNYDVALARVPELLDIPMVKIEYADVLRAVRSLSMAASSINLTIQKIKALFSYAADVYRLFPVNPIAKLPYMKERKDKRVKALTASELDDLLEKMKENEFTMFYVMCCIAGYAGLRFGEICGLTSSDIDIPNLTIHVNKQWGLVDKGTYEFKTPKSNNGFRDVPIPMKLAGILSEYMEHRRTIDFTRRLFTINESSYLNARIKKYYPSCSVHQLRHTYATLLLAHGVDVKTVSALLGDRVETIMKTYIHYTDDMRDQAKKDVQKIFG